jgi:hypothetical protein
MRTAFGAAKVLSVEPIFMTVGLDPEAILTDNESR